MPDHVRIPLQTAASRAAAAGHPLDEREGLAILLEALRLSAERGICVAEGAVCIDAEGKLSFRPHGPDLQRRDAAAQVKAACQLADALFRGTPPLPLEPASFPTLEQLIVAAELRVLRSGDARLATQSEARRVAAALFARAVAAAETPKPDASEVITDKLPFPEGAPVAVEEAPLLSQIPGLADRDLYRDPEAAAAASRPPGEVFSRTDPPPGAEGPREEARPEASSLISEVKVALPAAFAPAPRVRENATGLAPQPTAPLASPAGPELPGGAQEVPSPADAAPPSTKGRWMIPAALLLAAASAFPFGRTSPAHRPAPAARSGPEERRESANAAAPAASPRPSPPRAKAKVTAVAPPILVASQAPAPPAPRTAARQLEAGERAAEAGRYFQAIIAFRNALEGPIPVPRAARRLGDVYLLQDETEQAAAAYREYLELAPDAPDADEVRAALDDLEEP